MPAPAFANHVTNPQCPYCVDFVSDSPLPPTHPEPIGEFSLDATPKDLVWVELVCHGRWDVTPVVRAEIVLHPPRSRLWRGCEIREPTGWRQAYRTLCGCCARLEDLRISRECIMPKLFVSGFLVFGNAEGTPTGHVALPIAHLVQHFARCG